jgi:1-deoxy-D-xylulose-5-phosphate reductoisomerase
VRTPGGIDPTEAGARASPAKGRLGVAVLGSTGSIGRQTLDVLARLGDRFDVVALAAARDAEALSAQVAAARPRAVALADRGASAGLLLPEGTHLEDGDDALIALATRPDVDLVVVATGGLISLRPVLAALDAGKIVATANKETLVAGGHLVLPRAERLARTVADDPERGPGHPQADRLAWLRPIDSEHSAIWQCLVGEPSGSFERLMLTASGGPFRLGPKDLRSVRPQDALRHPTWRMGAKVTIDSATLMNKGLEVIEAHWLYDAPYERIDVVIHPQSVIHSAVVFRDGSLKAQLGPPDMHLPIQYALTYPERPSAAVTAVSLATLGELSFGSPDEGRFPALPLAREAGRRGPWASAALIVADEVAVQRFLGGTLDFLGIPRLVEAAVEHFGAPGDRPDPSLDELVELEAAVRAYCRANQGGTDR